MGDVGEGSDAQRSLQSFHARAAQPNTPANDGCGPRATEEMRRLDGECDFCLIFPDRPRPCCEACYAFLSCIRQLKDKSMMYHM